MVTLTAWMGVTSSVVTNPADQMESAMSQRKLCVSLTASVSAGLARSVEVSNLINFVVHSVRHWRCDGESDCKAGQILAKKSYMSPVS